MNLTLPIIACLCASSFSVTSVLSQDEVSIVPSTSPAAVADEVEVAGIEHSRVQSSESDVDRRLREALNAADNRYWKNRARMKTLPKDRWTPRQAGWIDASGRPLVINWPWWAW